MSLLCCGLGVGENRDFGPGDARHFVRFYKKPPERVRRLRKMADGEMLCLVPPYWSTMNHPETDEAKLQLQNVVGNSLMQHVIELLSVKRSGKSFIRHMKPLEKTTPDGRFTLARVQDYMMDGKSILEMRINPPCGHPKVLDVGSACPTCTYGCGYPIANLKKAGKVLLHTTAIEDEGGVPLQREREATLPHLGFHLHGKFYNLRTRHWVNIWTAGEGEPWQPTS